MFFHHQEGTTMLMNKMAAMIQKDFVISPSKMLNTCKYKNRHCVTLATIMQKDVFDHNFWTKALMDNDFWHLDLCF